MNEPKLQSKKGTGIIPKITANSKASREREINDDGGLTDLTF